ncbi:MAG: glutamine--fructose-6-phosphate transaminase (isomerizing) [Betaproteobacteria bacterium]
MCGIVGYIGPRQATPILIENLKKLEYRGYDSAGIAVMGSESIEVRKTEGRLAKLEAQLEGEVLAGSVGIGHTRWATHGRPSDVNAHPHSDCKGQLAVVHNGIIENHLVLREWLEARGHVFRSETDTEVLPHLIEEYYNGDLAGAVRQALSRAQGSFAIAVISRRDPHCIVAARKDSPLIIGLGKGENFLASDIPAVMAATREVLVMEDGEVAILTRDNVIVQDLKGREIKKQVVHVKWDPVMAEKGGYAHFMLKEIHEQPRAIQDTLTGRIDKGAKTVNLHEIPITAADLEGTDKIFIVACGTAYHAGLVGKKLIERLVRIPVEVDVASEFRYRDPMVSPRTLTIVVSQSGETADTLAALREAKKRGSRVIAITNVVGSSVAREADDVLYTWAGPEIAVASTKAYMTQLVALALIAVGLGRRRGTVSLHEEQEIVREMEKLPMYAEEILLGQDSVVRELAQELHQAEQMFFIGRGLDYAVSMEGSLKLKEISYINAQAYPAGELKHGTLALVVKGVPVIALATQRDVYEKMLSNIKEVKARDATVVALALDGDEEIRKSVDHVLYIPRTSPYLAPVLAVIPLQLFAYYAAVARGCDVDKPRNLAKSVTVE